MTMSHPSIQDIPDLHLAIRKGQFQDIRYLVSLGEDVNVKDGAEHRTPLMLCAMIEQEQWGVGIARLLLAQGAMVGHSDRRGQNALMTACIHGRAELVKVFLKAVDYDPNQRDRYGNTALFYAASRGNEEVVEALVASLLHFKLSLDKANKWGMTPLLEACRLGHKTIAQMLEEQGASIDVQDAMLHWGLTEWRHYHEQHVIEEVPRKRSYDKPWLRNKDLHTRKRSVSITSTRNGTDGLPSIPNSRTSHRSDMDDEVFLPPTIVVSQTKSENAITETPRTPLRVQKNLPPTATKRRMLFKSWIQDLTKGQEITAVFLPAPASTESLQMQTAPNSSSSSSLTRQRARNSRNQIFDWSVGPHFPNNLIFKQIFQRYEIQSSDSFRQRAKTPDHIKIPQIHPEVDQTPRQSNAKLLRQQSKMSLNSSSNRLSSSSSSMDSGRKSKTGDLRVRATERGKVEDSASSVSSEDSSAARMMINAFRRRKGSVVPSALADK